MDFSKFEQLLDDQITWPNKYTFKFITKTEQIELLRDALTEHDIQERASRNGKYTSISSRKIVNSSKEVIEIYKEIGKIEGVITL